MTKYIFLTIFFTLLVGNIIDNNNQLHAQIPTPLFDEKKSLNNFSTVSNTDVFAIDLDNDNFVDILSTSYDGNKIA